MSYGSTHVDIEIQTLIHSTHGIHQDSDSVSSLLPYQQHKDSSEVGIHLRKDGRPLWLNTAYSHRQHSSDSESSTGSTDVSLGALKVKGADIGDFLTEYTVKGLRPDEIPVIGTYVDKRVIPGFRYKVRSLTSKNYMFDGRALQLLSVGMGYGKRITMEGDNLNNNDNYFYSDTSAQGYGFSLHAISTGDKFVIYDEQQSAIGGATIENVQSQKEMTTEITDSGQVKKTVSVVLTCSLRFLGEPNCLSLFSRKSAQVQGILVIIKERKLRQAQLKFIHINLDHIGACTLELV